jgi:hypothetical protein
MTRLLNGFLGTTVLLAGLLGTANGDLIGEHSGVADPSTEGFTPVFFPSNYNVTQGPISNDMGKPAWSISTLDQISQYGYASGALSATQQAEIAATGFTLTMTARVLPGTAPAYDSINHVVIAGADLDTGVKRYEIGLGLNSSGDTVAVLATSVDNGGPGFSIREPGPSYTLTGSGGGWHTYSLVYSATTQLADLFVDGVDRIQGYAGHTSFVGNRGLVWAAFSGGQGDFNLVRAETGNLSPVPEPSTLVVSLTTLILGLSCVRRRRTSP